MRRHYPRAGGRIRRLAAQWRRRQWRRRQWRRRGRQQLLSGRDRGAASAAAVRSGATAAPAAPAAPVCASQNEQRQVLRAPLAAGAVDAVGSALSSTIVQYRYDYFTRGAGNCPQRVTSLLRHVNEVNFIINVHGCEHYKGGTGWKAGCCVCPASSSPSNGSKSKRAQLPRRQAFEHGNSNPNRSCTWSSVSVRWRSCAVEDPMDEAQCAHQAPPEWRWPWRRAVCNTQHRKSPRPSTHGSAYLLHPATACSP